MTEKFLQKELSKPKYAPLTREEETAVVLKAQNDDEQAKKTLIERNLRLVYKKAIDFKEKNGTSIDIADLVANCVCDLDKCIKSFDPGKGVRFSSYCSMTIQQALYKSKNEQKCIVTIPEKVALLQNKLYKAASSFEAEKKREASNEELAEMLGLRIDDVKWCRNEFKSVSLLSETDETSDSDMQNDCDCDKQDDRDCDKQIDCYSYLQGNCYSYMQNEDENENILEQDAWTNLGSYGADYKFGVNEGNEIDRALASLPQREEKILRMSFGIGENERHVYEIAEQLNLSGERVRQPKKKAICTLREGASELLRQYLVA